MKATTLEIEKYLNVLEEIPRRIEIATKGFADSSLKAKPDAKPWSVNDILAHIRSCADLWGHSIYSMLTEKEPEFSDINERKWAKVTRYAELPFAESFQVFVLQRKSLLLVLKALPFDSWERSGLIFRRRHTVFTQTRRMAKHEDDHAGQIESLLRERTDRR